MTEKEKEQKALEIYQQLMHALADITDKEGVICCLADNSIAKIAH